MTEEECERYMKMFQVTFEETDQVFRPLAEKGAEGTGSMGDDTPIAVLSQQIRPLYDYFRQQFAQVTNPPIDSLRETIVMSLETRLGKEFNIFNETPELADRIILHSPLLSPRKFFTLKNTDRPGFDGAEISLSYDPSKGLEQAIENVVEVTEQYVRDGKSLLFLSERLPEKANWLSMLCWQLPPCITTSALKGCAAIPILLLKPVAPGIHTRLPA